MVVASTEVAFQRQPGHLVFFVALSLSAVAQPPPGVSLFFSEYAEGPDNNRYVEIFSSGAVTASLQDFKLVTIGSDGEAEPMRHDLLPLQMRAGSLHIVSDEGARDPMIVAMSTQRLLSPFNGSNLLALIYEPDGTVMDAIGHLADPVGQCTTGAWDVCGVATATKGHTLVRKRHVTRGNGGHWAASAGTNAEDCEWRVHEGTHTKDIASHTVDSLATSPNRTSVPLMLSELQSVAQAQLETCPRYRPHIRLKPRKRIQIRLTNSLKASPYLQGYLRANRRWRVKTRPRYVLSTGKTIKFRPILVTTTTSASEGQPEEASQPEYTIADDAVLEEGAEES